jgi:hypothetical protein
VDPLGETGTAERARLAGQDLERFKARVAELDRLRDTVAPVENPIVETQ